MVRSAFPSPRWHRRTEVLTWGFPEVTATGGAAVMHWADKAVRLGINVRPSRSIRLSAPDWFVLGLLEKGVMYDIMTEFVFEFAREAGRAERFEVRAPGDRLMAKASRTK